VFIRSLATRGHLGGLSAATLDVVTVLAASGKDVVLIETVGVGQDEVEIVATADVSVVVLVPGLGDEVQALKAGIMEIADVFVVNKSDREGADRVVAEIQSMLSMGSHDGHPPAIVKTVATQAGGIDALLDAIESYRQLAEREGLLPRKRRAQLRRQLEASLEAQLLRRIRERVLAPADMEAWLDRLAARETDPSSAAEEILGKAGL
jgi:LAO/AO transport system kinase